ncbi:MAG: hypothetical protein AB4372_29580 [Xenococcus sp. (in: cyanobacteria)]
MESEARQNPLSKSKTIEQLRTTIDKLETIIEQLDSTSVVNLPSSKTVEALITTTEALENAISNLPPEAVTADSEVTPMSEVVEDQPVVTPIPPEETPPVVKSEIPVSQTLVTEPSGNNTAEQIEPIAAQNIPEAVTKTPAKSSKKKKRNWIPIAIVALILAIIPISLKYLSPETTPQIFSEKTEEIVEKTIIAEPPVIASNLPDNNLPKNEEQSVSSPAQEPLVEITTKTINQETIEDKTIIEPLKQQEVAEIRETPTTDLIREEVVETDLEKPLPQEQPQSKLAIKTEIETSLTNQESETIIASNNSQPPESIEIATTSSSKSPSNVNSIEDKKLTLEINKIPEKDLEPEHSIIIPENLATEITAQPLELKTVVHDIQLTPEQNLIALLSEKVLELSENYQDDLILSIEPNMANNILFVRIADDWYQLESTKQDEIVADLFARSQELEFRKLEIKDQNDNLVARSPVVGQNMIIFRRDS